MTITLTTTPPPNFFAPCKSNLQLYASTTGELINPLSGIADLILGNFIQTRNDGEFSYPKNVLNSPSFTIIMNLSFTNALGGTNCILDAYPKMKFRRNSSNDFGIVWEDTINGEQSILIPSARDVAQDEVFEVAITCNVVSASFVTTKLYFNGELMGSYVGNNVNQLMNFTTGDYVKINTPTELANAKIYSISIWNGKALDRYSIKNHYEGIANYFYSWDSCPPTDSWDSGVLSSRQISDSFKEDSLLTASEYLSVTDTYNHIWGGVLKLVETLVINESNPKHFTIKKVSDYFSITDGDKSFKTFRNNNIVSIPFNEVLGKTSEWNRIYVENISILDKNPKLYEFYCEDFFMPYEGSPLLTNHVTKGVNRDITFTEIIDKTSIWKRYWMENISVTEEGTGREYLLRQFMEILIDEQYIRNAFAVISDIEFRNEELDLSNFYDVTQSPTGYSAFRDFISGDYTYKDALMKVLLSSDITADRPYVTEWTLNVDVPDVTDRGTVELTATNQPVHVSFNKSYHIAPEVGGLVKAVENIIGEIPTPAIYNITEEGFDMILKSGVSYVEGKVTWTSTGY